MIPASNAGEMQEWMAIIDKAIDVLHNKGWGRHNYIDGVTGHHCTLGALQAATAGRDSLPLYQAGFYTAPYGVKAAVAQAIGVPSNAIASWNDHVARDADDVIAHLKTARENLAIELDRISG